ncbi:MAG: hypothetical protein SOW55_06575 [Bacilli bacterium]|nr:hypothetical protein [Bacillales bacterium]MDY2575612.1 hypothetical protein [Bacilli bacterium]
MEEEKNIQENNEVKEEKEEVVEETEKIFKDVKEEKKPNQTTRFCPGEFYNPLPFSSKEETLKNINDSRSAFYLNVTHSNKIKKITLFSFLGIFLILGLIMLINPDSVNKLFIPVLALFVTFLLVSFILISSMKKKRNFFFDEYKYTYFLNIDSYCYTQTGIANLELSYNSKIELDEVNKIDCYENILTTPTRDIVKGTMFGVNFTSYDLLIKTGNSLEDKKTQSVIFSGKMFNFNLLTKKSGKLVIYLKGCGDSFPTELKGLDPTSIKDLKKEYQVFTSFDNPESMLNKKMIESLNKLAIDDVVEDIIISINKNGLFIGLSLTSFYMTIPFENDVDDKFINHYKRDIEIITSFISALLSNKNYEKNN